MTIVFFDERFNYVAENSTALRVYQQGNGAAPLVLANIKAPKNGFAYIYLSNESAEPVYFDDFTVSDTRGRIIEEDHYYAYGLKIAGISSKKLGDVNEGLLDNKNLYNDKELIDEADLDWYDYGFRNYDPQIGRFTQLDPLTDDYPELTPYQYASCEPIGNVDVDGLEGGSAVLGHVGDAVVTQATFLQNIVFVLPKATAAANAAKKIATISKVLMAYKIGKTVTDHTQIKNTIRNLNVPSKHESSLLSRINDWFKSLNGGGTIPVGSGSHQKAGAVFDGNDGTVDSYSDKADNITDNYHMGPFFTLNKTIKPSAFEGTKEIPGPVTNPTVQHTLNSADELSKTGEHVYEAAHEEKHINSTINIKTESNYKPQELKEFRRDSIGKHKDTFHIYEYKYVPKN